MKRLIFWFIGHDWYAKDDPDPWGNRPCRARVP